MVDHVLIVFFSRYDEQLFSGKQLQPVLYENTVKADHKHHLKHGMSIMLENYEVKNESVPYVIKHSTGCHRC